MNINIDVNSGFCFGVVYAIQMAEDELEENKKKQKDLKEKLKLAKLTKEA